MGNKAGPGIVRIHTGAGRTHRQRVSTTFSGLGKTRTNCSCAADADEIRTWRLWISSPTPYHLSHHVSLGLPPGERGGGGSGGGGGSLILSLGLARLMRTLVSVQNKTTVWLRVRTGRLRTMLLGG